MKESQSDPIAYSIFFQLLVGLILGLVAVFSGVRLPDNFWFLWPHLLLMILLYSFANVMWFKSLKTTEVSQAAIFLPTKIFWMVSGAAIFLKESINAFNILGTMLIFGAIFLATYKKGERFKFTTGAMVLLVASFFYGFAFVNDGFLVKNLNVFLYSSLAFLLPALTTLIFQPFALPKMKVFLEKERLIRILIASGLLAIGSAATYLAYQKGGNISQIGPISQISIILTVVFGIVFLGEREKTLQKIVGAVISIVGVLLILR